MQDTRYNLTERAEQVMSLVDRLLAMPPEDRMDMAHDLYAASQYFMSHEDDLEGATCLLDALNRLAAVGPSVGGDGNVH